LGVISDFITQSRPLWDFTPHPPVGDWEMGRREQVFKVWLGVNRTIKNGFGVRCPWRKYLSQTLESISFASGMLTTGCSYICTSVRMT